MAGAGITDTAVRKATGRGWGDWYETLDAAGARTMTHQQIVSIVARHNPPIWWQQTITVTYEQARSLRQKHQRDDGFAAHASRTIPAGVARIFAAWTDDAQRSAWLDTTGWTIRKATPCRSLRVTWKDGRTHVEVHLWPRAEARSVVQVEHTRLGSPDEVQQMKTFWHAALDRLAEHLEAAELPNALAVAAA